MKPVRYVVKTGDTLWSIAETHYGDPVRWPDLYAYNNRPDVVALTERRIVNPDRMVPGQAIFLPPGQPRPSQRRAPSGQAANPLRAVGSAGLPQPGGTAIAPNSSRGLPGQGRPGVNPGGFGGIGARAGATLVSDSLSRNAAAETLVNDFAHVFRLDGEAVMARGQAFSATLFLHGSVSLQRTGQVTLLSYSNRGAEIQARSQSAMLLGQLLSTRSTRLGFDPRGNRVAYEALLTRNAALSSPDAALAEGVNERGQPVLKGRIAMPDFSGRVANHVYVARDLVVAVELTAGRTVEPTRQTASGGRRTNERADWQWAAAVARPSILMVGAILEEDAVTSGGGLSDAATTLAGTVVGRRGGSSMLRFATASPTPVQIGGADRSAS